MSTLPKTFITPEEYLEIERKAEFKSEYYNGEMFAMAGARESHDVLAGNIRFQLQLQLRRRDCIIFSSDMRVHVPATGLYTYPDAAVVCGERLFLDDRHDTLLNPSLIVEVLSPSIEIYDRGRKFDNYRSIESLMEYLMVSTDRVHADLLTRHTDELWMLRVADKPADVIEIRSIDCRLTLADIYEKVDLGL